MQVGIHSQPHKPRGPLQWARRMLLGRPIETAAHLSHRLPIILALPVLASDALSSNAYATEEIMLVLATAHRFLAGPGTLQLVIPISAAIAVMMFIIAASYRRAVMLYPTSGGSYTVSKNNLGALPGVIAGSALVIDYILTVSVSVAAGVAAITSYAPALFPYSVSLCLCLIAIIAWINLRGTRDSGLAFALPAYGFIVMMAVLLGTFLYRLVTHQYSAMPLPEEAVTATQGLGLFVVLKAFSNGCAALTGVEAISNGVQIFQPPEAKNAAKTLLILILTSIAIFMGLGFAAYVYHVVPSHSETLVSLIARHTFLSDGLFSPAIGHILFAATIGSVLAVLIIASNTAFADFPRLLSFMAQDGYAPRVLLGLGERLVYSRSIVYLAVISGALIWALNASVSSLIGLYAVGVFICFTLSQAGMLRRILRDREPGWFSAAVINVAGASVTGIVAVVIAVSKFSQGAWVVVILIPLLVSAAMAIRRHYDWFERRMTIRKGDVGLLSDRINHLTVVVLLSSDIHRGTLEGLETARAIVQGRKNSDLRALHVEIDPNKTQRLMTKWKEIVQPKMGTLIELDVVPSPFRTLINPVVDYVKSLTSHHSGERVVVLIPEFETGSLFSRILHNQTAPQLRKALFNVPDITVITNRFFMRSD
jgi:amino acid transporter